MDKGGNFIGWLYVDGVNLSVALVEEGFAKVHFTAERSSHFKALQHAETKAKDSKLNVSLFSSVCRWRVYYTCSYLQLPLLWLCKFCWRCYSAFLDICFPVVTLPKSSALCDICDISALLLHTYSV